MTNASGKTVLLFGGSSPEREVSLMSGEMAKLAMERLNIDAEVFDPAQQNVAELVDMKPSCAFNLLHGGAGENGEMQGVLRMFGIPCTGSGVLASALTMDKHRTKLLWTTAGIPTPKWELASTEKEAEAAAGVLKFPVFVKPSCGGSSTNSSFVESKAGLADAVLAAASEGAPALVEEYVEGREYTAAILDDESLPLVGIAAQGVFYDYHAKYVSEETQFTCPCGLSADEEQGIQKTALQAFRMPGCRQWGRVDLILSESQGPMFLEVNTVPGMTSHSLVPMAAAAAGMNYDQLIRRIWQGAA